jgi:hypothetical protein
VAKKMKQGEKTPHTTKSQRFSIIKWLRNESNFRLITGLAAAENTQDLSGKKSGKKLKKADAYRSLASFVTRESNISWTAYQAKNRFETYLSFYKKAKLASEQPGWCVNDEDIAKGIKTIEQKLETLCPYFKEMDALFGDHATFTDETTPRIPLEVGPEINAALEADEADENEEEQSTVSSEDSINQEGLQSPMKKAAFDDNSSEISTNSGQKRKDFSTVYSEQSREELEFNKKKIRLEMEMRKREVDLQIKRLNFDKEIEIKKMDMEAKKIRASIINTLIEQGKSPQEIKEYLKLL